ncbi:MAG TPA: M1 family peptidase, partial [Streptosporangiaceae bacterium]
MRKRIALLIGPVLALLLVLVALAIPWRASKSAPATHPRPPSATAVATAPPAVGADGIGDPYFPRAGNGGYDITAYDIAVRYDPPTDR